VAGDTPAVLKKDLQEESAMTSKAIAIHACPSAAREDATRKRVNWSSLLATWLANRVARRQLLRYQTMDPRFAKDIGLSHGDMVMEASAPFWVEVRARRESRRGDRRIECPRKS
jgi:uncharacterized protein YjiS (DUF1127 family)